MPARKPPTMVARNLISSTEWPIARAASALSPAVRINRPQRVVLNAQ
ncbi:hypothetical protein ACVINW_007803 [Bradyrhizobium sp. USDA 4461]